MSTRNVISPIARLAFPALFEKKSTFGGDARYEATLIFPANADLSALEAAIEAAVEEKWPGNSRPTKWRHPIRDGAEKDRAGFGQGTKFLTARSNYQPGIVDAKVRAIIDPEEVYAGCYVIADLRAFAYEVGGNKGVSFGLQNIQKVEDGEKLAGPRRPDQAFEVYENLPLVEFRDRGLEDILGS